jgi:hypothetical protein
VQSLLEYALLLRGYEQAGFDEAPSPIAKPWGIGLGDDVFNAQFLQDGSDWP